MVKSVNDDYFSSFLMGNTVVANLHKKEIRISLLNYR